MKPSDSSPAKAVLPSDPEPKNGRQDSKTESESQIVLERLVGEFDRLNTEFFAGGLRRPDIRFSTRKTYGGYYRPSENRIVLSWQAYREHGWNETLNTFRHEVAHIVHQNHSKAFWDLALRLGVTHRYAAAPAVRTRRQKRYTYVCPACGQRIVCARRIKPSSCALCDRKFNPLYLFKLVSAE